jgi:hypothetical protein
MSNRRSLNRVLRDAIGKGLTKEEVRILARHSLRGTGVLEDNLTYALDKCTEAELIKLAAAPNGYYSDDQVAAHGWKYR